MKIPIKGPQRLNAVKTETSLFSIPWRTAAVLILSCAFGLGAGQAFAADYTYTHTFTIDDLVGGFDGRTYGPDGNYTDPDILCGIAGSTGCPAGVSPKTDKQGNTLYPIDSEFGFYVTDFAGGIPKTADGDYMEGFAGTIFDGGVPVGIAVSNVATDTLRVPSGLGTWCAGLGNTSVKCSAEQYVVMESVKTCYETIPYIYGDDERANPATGDQAVLDYDGEPVLCSEKKLDNALYIIGGVFDEGGIQIPGLEPGTLIESDQILYDGIDGWLLPNESTVLENIAESSDYSVTGKDDGKPLYRWGDLHKRPNDIRMYARMTLPAEWKTAGAMAANGGLGLRVESAILSVDHVVTNNPNDQLRPEDMENEGAIGRKPSGIEVAGVGMLSTQDCYEADADFIPSGSVYRNDMFPYAAYPLVPPVVGATEGTDPYLWSSDLKGGWTNGWYTTVEREPFEWAYDSDGDLLPDYGSPVPLVTADTLLSGPRWRLTAQKFGQTVPGLEIPIIECSEPPYQKDNIKYDVGADQTTVINLLDWNPKDERSVIDPDTGLKVSPLAFSNGWLDHAANDGTVVTDLVPTNPDLDAISINGAPVSEDFDLSVYVKGDKKATKVFDATLAMTYEDYVPPLDVSALSLAAPAQVLINDPVTVTFTVDNPHAVEVVDAAIQICGVGTVEGCVNSLETLAATSQPVFTADFTAPAAAQDIDWTATVTAPAPFDTDDTNNQAFASTEVTAIPVNVDLDMQLASLTGVPTRVFGTNRTLTMVATACNLDAVANASGNITLVGIDSMGSPPVTFAPQAFTDLAAGTCANATFVWTAPLQAMRIMFTAEVALTSGVDTNPSNDTLTSIQVVVFPR